MDRIACIEYREQPKFDGVIPIFFLTDDFPLATAGFDAGITIFACQTRDPERFGAVKLNRESQILSLEEKPAKTTINFAVPSVYIDDGQVVKITRGIKPSAHGELEFTDVNLEYFHSNQLNVYRLSCGFVWLDAGIYSSLQDVSAYIESIERRQGVKISCPEVPLVLEFITLAEFEVLPDVMASYKSRDYLQRVTLKNRQGYL